MVDVRFYGSIQKVDHEARTVSGYASTEAIDSDGETILRSGIEEALADYMKFAAVREMHQPSAVGTTENAFVDGRGLYVTVKVVDDNAWRKVKAHVYKGFSVGGKVRERDPSNRKIIRRLALSEISLVDRPSNPEAVFDVWKASDISRALRPELGAAMAKASLKKYFDGLEPEERAHVLIKAAHAMPIRPPWLGVRK